MNNEKDDLIEKYLQEDKIKSLDKIQEKNITEVHAKLLSNEDLEELYERIMDGISKTTPRIFVDPRMHPARYKEKEEELTKIANVQRSIYEIQKSLYNSEMVFAKETEAKCSPFMKRVKLREIATQEVLEKLWVDPDCEILVPMLPDEFKYKKEKRKLQ